MWKAIANIVIQAHTDTRVVMRCCGWEASTHMCFVRARATVSATVFIDVVWSREDASNAQPLGLLIMGEVCPCRQLSPHGVPTPAELVKSALPSSCSTPLATLNFTIAVSRRWLERTENGVGHEIFSSPPPLRLRNVRMA